MYRQTDYIIVGFGIAGASFAALLEQKGKRFVVIDANEYSDTRVIGGMYNPVILKRFTPAWKAHEFWTGTSRKFYENEEKRFKIKLIYSFDVHRILHDIQEQNNWIAASDRPVLQEYMEPEIHRHTIQGIDTPYGTGVLHRVGRVHGDLYVRTYKQYLLKNNAFREEHFDYGEIRFFQDQVRYKDITASRIVFAEGGYMVHNPYFNYLPLMGTKGEMITVAVNGLPEVYVKSSVFMIMTEPEIYRVGSTYNWQDKSRLPTGNGEAELRRKLETFLSLPYEVIDRKADIRPTVKDRRPLIGTHPEMHKLSVLNGLGTRGIIFAPALSEILYNFLEHKIPIPEEMNIDRFIHYNKKESV